LRPTARERDHRQIAVLTDTARFLQSDPDELVRASLACPVCLHAEGVARQDALEGYDPSVSCRCSTCDARWRVYLTPEQALRLGLMHAHA
jgi:DNA-directed RNA polymerase subunit M/transcription elongation factor TFIIS